MADTTPILAPAPLPLDRMYAAAQEASGLLKALSNPDRLLILCFLSQGEARVGEIEAALGIVQPTLSQQLTVLREQRLVSARREGKNVHYALASSPALALIETLYAQFCCDGSAAPRGRANPKPETKE